MIANLPKFGSATSEVRGLIRGEVRRSTSRARGLIWESPGVDFESSGFYLAQVLGSISGVRGLIGRGLGVDFESLGLDLAKVRESI